MKDYLNNHLCGSCASRFRGICSALNIKELNDFSKLTKHQHYKKKSHIVRLDDKVDRIYNVINGSVCQYKILDDGRKQILGFLFPGDFLGIPFEENYSYFADAIEDSCLCIFNREDFEDFLQKSPKFEKIVLKKTSLKLTESFEHSVLLGKKNAEEKLATFLILISKIQEIYKKDENVFNLPMTREDISDYLGLRMETTSRIFSLFVRKSLIKFSNKKNDNFLITNMNGLKKESKLNP